MRRLVVTGADAFEVVDAPAPTPAPDQLLIAPLLVGICATDLELIDGSLVYLRTGELTLPLTPGHEWVGRVVEVGAAVTSFARDDLVVGECSIGCGRCAFCRAGDYHQCPTRRETGIIGLDGALQELMVFPASSAHRIPANTNAADAALIEPTAVAFRAIQRSDLGPGGTVLIVGAGTQGFLAATIAAKLLRADVAIVDPVPARVDRLRDLGVRPPHPGEQFTHVLEAAGTKGSLDAACAALAPGGRLVILGLSGLPTVAVGIDTLVVKNQTLIGSIGSPHVWPEVIAHVAGGTLEPSQLVTQIYDLEDFAAAHALLCRKDPAVGKVLISPNGYRRT